MNSNLCKYAFDLAEDYMIFSLESGWKEGESMRPEAYIKARLKNVQDELFRYTVEQIQKMGVDV